MHSVPWQCNFLKMPGHVPKKKKTLSYAILPIFRMRDLAKELNKQLKICFSRYTVHFLNGVCFTSRKSAIHISRLPNWSLEAGKNIPRRLKVAVIGHKFDLSIPRQGLFFL